MILLAGCVSSRDYASYNAEQNQMVYRTGSITIDQRFFSSGYAGGTALTMQAVARCGGKGCTPDEATLLFLADGETNVSISDRSLQLSGGEVNLQWNDPYRQGAEQQRQQRIVGTVTRASITLSNLRRVATANAIEGRIGGRTFDLGSAALERLVDFVEAAETGGAASSENSEPDDNS
jgi:hypothetical protein